MGEKMRRLLLILLALCLAGGVQAGPMTDSRLAPPHKTASAGDGARWGRQGGDTISTAIPIPALPFHDIGATCGAADDYDEACPWTDSTAPDVVYQYTPAVDQSINISLCPSLFDTKVYVYAGSAGHPIACNDDACGSLGLQSQLTAVALSAGVTYFIVVDGYGTDCGTYDLTVEHSVPCSLICPPGSVAEGEPPCGPGYLDTTNGGCNASPPVFQTLSAGSDGCMGFCGQSGTFAVGSAQYRDTDWLDIIGTGEPVTVRGTAAFPLQLLLIYTLDCELPQFDSALADACVPAELTRFLPAGLHAWIWVGPQAGRDVACGALYTLQVCGIQGGPVPLTHESWGRIKNLYRQRGAR